MDRCADFPDVARYNRSLRFLFLAENHISNSGAMTLLSRNHLKLTSLDLSANLISNSCVEPLAALWRNRRALQHLGRTTPRPRTLAA